MTTVERGLTHDTYVSTTSCFLNASGYKIFCRYWEPQETPRALVFIIHGMAEHSLVYESLARVLASKKFFVCAHDHQGHGLSEGPRLYIDTFQQFIQDVHRHVEIIKQQKFPDMDMPVFAVAHSMGGTVTTLANLKRPMFKGVVYVAPALYPNPETITPFKVALTHLLGRTVSQFPVGHLDFNLACRCPLRIEEMKKDKLYCHGYLRAGFALTFLKAAKEAISKLSDVDFPFLMLSGDEDKICDLRGAKALYEISPSKDKSIKVYNKAYHCLHLEPDGVKEQVMQDIIKWLSLRS